MHPTPINEITTIAVISCRGDGDLVPDRQKSMTAIRHKTGTMNTPVNLAVIARPTASPTMIILATVGRWMYL